MGRPSGGQVEGLAGAERSAVGAGLLEPFFAEVGAHLVEAFPAGACFKFFPRLPGTESLPRAAENGCLVPVARVRGQAREASLHCAPPAPSEASAARPLAARARDHRFADIRGARERFAISRSLASASMISAAADRTAPGEPAPP